MNDWNMPPGVSVRDIPGYDDPPPLDRCEVCGCWLSFDPQRVEIKYLNGHCSGESIGDPVAGFTYYPCHGSEGQTDGPHAAHDWQEYDGQREYRTCSHCGFEGNETVSY
jgi:hypothetical protein